MAQAPEINAEPPQSAQEQATAPIYSDVEAIVRGAARKYGISEDYFVTLAICESSMNPNAVNYNYYENGNPSGLFQHISGYFPARALKYGYSTDVFNAEANAGVTAAMFADGASNLWACK